MSGTLKAVGVMTCAKRTEMAAALVENLRGQGLPEPVVMVDEEMRGPLWCAVRSWRKLVEEARRVEAGPEDLVLLVQDDAVPCRDVQYGIERTHRIIGFGKCGRFFSHYSPRKVDDDARSRGVHWTWARKSDINGPAISTHLAAAEPLSRWLDKYFDDPPPTSWGAVWDDAEVVGAFVRLNGAFGGSWTPVPTLFEHGASGESLIRGHNNSGRVSRWTLAPNGSAFDVRWYLGRGDPVRRPSGHGVRAEHMDEVRKVMREKDATL